ncbi:hypothetical protein HDU82_007209 [Entophlyctis luteolus]|nr:hypothetical protein HDU82_007209 [Entophlyctis luteolus]
MTPKSASKIKLRGFTPSHAPSDFFGGLSSTTNGAASTPVPKSVLGMLKDDGAGDSIGTVTSGIGGSGYPGSFKPRVKKLIIPDDAENGGPNDDIFTENANSTPARKTESGKAESTRSVRFLDESSSVKIPTVDVTQSARNTGGLVDADPEPSGSGASSLSSTPMRALSMSGKKVSPYQASQEVAYETEPSLDQLLEMSDVELTHVEGYTVRLPGVGQVKFLKPVNLLEASPNNARSGISKIPGTVVILKHKVIEVYPDGTRKDPVGVGVNVPAVVKLEKCWVVDKSTGLVIDDESDPRFDRHMKRLANMEGTELLGFNTTTGTWRFKVEHFSRYGFDDDEDEEEGVPAESAEKAVPETSLEDKVADDSIAEESDEDDEDASFIGNDSFAHLKSWKPPVGKKVHDLRRVAALNSRAKSLELARQQQLLEKQRGLEEEIEDETFENDDSSDEAADRSLVSVGGNSAGAVERKSAITSPEHSNEEPMIISGFGSLNTDRKLSNMRSVLFQDRESSSQQHAALNSSKFFSPKRGIESMMDYENSNTKEGSAKLNTISIGEEFLLEQSPAKFKRVTSLPPVSTSESTFKPKEKSPEHVVPVIQKSSMAVVPMKSLPNSYEFDFYDNGDTELSLPPLKESASYGHESSCVDAGLFMGRSSRVGWGPGGQFVVTGRSGYFRVDIANMRIFSRGEDIGASSQAEQARHVELLKVILDKATVPITSSLQTQAGEADRVMITSTQTPRSLLQSAPQNEAICPLALLDKSCKFSSLLSAVSSSHVFSESEKSIWTLASALFDDAELPLEESSLGDRVSDQIKISIQKQAVSTWLRNFAGSLRHAANGSNADLIYSHLITRHIGDAVKAAIKGRDFRLSTLLSQIGGVGSKVSVVSESLSLPGVGATNAKSSGHGVCYRSSTLESARQDISHQVEVWISRPQKTPIGEDYLRIWRLISGDVALWDFSVISSVGNWKQLFGLFLWYARGGSLSIGEAVSEYDDLRRSMKSALSPLPRHLESCDKAVSVMDICYNLLKLHSSGDFSLGSALLPLSISSNVLDYRITWLLWVLLSRAKHLREFSGHGNLVNIRLNEEGRRNSDMIVDGESSGNNDTYSMLVSKTADECTMSLVYALEGLGLWKWALFVALFLSTNIGRECCVRTILAKWYPGEDSSGSVMTNIRQKTGAAESEHWQFVVSRLNIPALWIHEAKVTGTLVITRYSRTNFQALRARYDGNILQECVSLIDAKLFNGAHQRIVFFLCPFEIINESYLPVQTILQQLLSSTSQIENWKYGGGFILEYVDFVMKSQNMSCTEQANLPELSNKGVALLKILAEIKGRAEWMTTGLGYCFDGRTIERSRKEWGVCWCCMSSKILKVVSEVENMCGLESQISGSLLAKLPLVEDVRGKYASDVIHRFL